MASHNELLYDDEQEKAVGVTYGELIDLYESSFADAAEQKQESADDLFIGRFHEKFSRYCLSRPKRFIETVQRILAPTKPSLRGPPKLTGSSLLTYRSRIWKPRVPNPKGSSSDAQFPVKLHLEYGIDEELLERCINAVQSSKETPWILCDTAVKAQFYQILHPFLKRWTKTQQSTKSSIGAFYMAIDKDFAGKRPDNVYRYVDSVLSKGPESYNLPCFSAKQDSHEAIDSLSHLSDEICDLREKLELSKKQLHLANCALRDITNEKLKVEKERDAAVKKAAKTQKSNKAAMEDIEQLIEELAHHSPPELELSTDDSGDPLFSPVNSDTVTNNSLKDLQFMDFTVTKSGKLYSNSVRKLYYTLLSSGVPVSKIETLVKDIVKWSNPSVDVSKLNLPKRSCASYLRKEELSVISNAHKATSLCDQIATGKGLRINTDGTTKNQKKIGGVALNGMTISVNELPDGSSLAALNDVARELDKLRRTAHALGIPNADSINWSMIQSSTSDSAATQKHFNDLLLQRKEVNSDPNCDGSNLTFVETFCSIHLGVNLRKACFSGINRLQAGSHSTASVNHFSVDTFVHQFCKVFGRHGTPEYGCGGQKFPDFLILMCEAESVPELKLEYYQQCHDVQLQRQVGNRYFVTACNASKIIFLMPAAIEFMEYTGIDKTGNKLEKEVYQKLKDEEEILQLLLDSLIYYHIYADLVMISKSKQLNKSTLDLNTHYLELKYFLTEAEKHPEIVLEEECQVFVSEKRLYGNEKATNHCLNEPSVNEAVLSAAKKHATPLEPLIVSGSRSMHEKLCAYAVNQLPGGIYWEPEHPAVRKILSELSPSNDLCESLLGLNDYLTTVIPNLHQMSRSNLVEVKKMEQFTGLKACKQRYRIK